MNTRFLLLLLILCFTAALPVRAGEEASGRLRYNVGVGLGPEAGSGLQLGVGSGSHDFRLGVGFLYGQNRDTFFSIGLRYFYYLFKSGLNNTYVWTGGGYSNAGNQDGSDYGAGLGVGPGVSFHFGTPFHLNLETGYHAFYDSYLLYSYDGKWVFTPTVSASLTYEW